MRIAVLVVLMLWALDGRADNQNAQASANGGAGGSASGVGNGFGGAGGVGHGGDSSSVSHGGAGGVGNGFGGAGGVGEGGHAEGGTGIGHGGDGTGGEANNAGNTLQTNQVRQSPAVFMGAPAPTAPCQASLGGFLSFIGGIGLAGSRTLEECEIRESSRIAHAIGQPQMAREIVCMGKYAAKTRACNE